ncbi:Peptidoglycan deacetylase [Pseudobythopirellula maris]|uniref:Peptidoglycan deacetylase n=1 Tax=Pseudobythopirellula maris TaxID=2527991 RepID=A0A5C5ZSI7_9BACT|nr:XrtA system polysaccharide deacetylase [Pseudobythopirellula maris]TWT89731.1 Peptidoglycan deacetylase [Pseudobythopirellula maris]
MTLAKPILNALSFDVEEHFHVHAFKRVIRREEWDSIPSRVTPSTRRVLRLLGKRGVRATFFFLGCVAEKHPDLVREAADGGHEIASHGYGHQSVRELTQEEFRRDLQRSCEAIAAACPTAELIGYRAPSFSIDESTPWALDELRRAGFLYDSSVSAASLHDSYGVRGAQRFAHTTPSGLVEIPPSTVRLLGQTVQAVGGGYFRLAPLPLTRLAARRINREGHPVVTYLHPWEFDPEQPRVRSASRRSKFRHYANLHKTERRLAKLLDDFNFGRMDEAFKEPIAEAHLAIGDHTPAAKANATHAATTN